MKRLKLLLTLFSLLLAAAAAGSAPKQSDAGPWDLRQLEKAPQYETAASKTVGEGEHSVELSEVYYSGETWLGKPTRVFAYLAKPARPEEKRLPAVVLVHGGGGKAFPQWARMWAERGYAALAMDLAGNGPDGWRLPDGGPDQSDETKFKRLREGVKNAWSYQAVADVIRGISLLQSMKDVDPRRIGITGISWGGYLTCIVMSLDHRLRAAVPVYGCGYLHENSYWVPTLAALPEEERHTWIENFDPSRYLPRCRTPVLWMTGTNDFAYPLDSYQKSYRAMPGPRALCITVKMPHSHEAGWARPEIQLFLDAILRPQTLERGIAQVGVPVVEGKRVRVAYDSPSAVQKCQIHWTADLDKPWQAREWQSATGEVPTLNEASAALPEARPLVFFLTLTDIRGAVISTEHVTLPAAH